MPIDITDYNITFRAPALPLPPSEYDQRYFDDINNVLRLYFNQLDQAFRSDRLVSQAEANAWFLS